MQKITRLITFTLICCVIEATTLPIVNGVTIAKNAQIPTIERIVHLASLNAKDSRYVYVPFDVPPHATRISVTYKYERANGANTIDIGLFDSRFNGTDTDSRGFRGWSGGRRSELFISRNEATPGYLSGALPAGTWRIILGLYKVAPAGVDVSFKIGIETEGNLLSGSRGEQRTSDASTAGAATNASGTEKGKENSLPPVQKIAGRNARWWRGDLHMHTVHSDGDWTIAGLISSALSGGLDFICITDHNTASHHAEIDRLRKGQSTPPLVMRGEEITTYGGHTNAWGLPTGAWIDFRVHAGDNARMSKVVDEAHRFGAVISINHPYALCGACDWSYDMTAPGFDAIEVWNGNWSMTNESALKMWDKILQSGRHLTAMASSDSHRSPPSPTGQPIGQPTTHVAAATLTQAALLDAIRQGHVYLTGVAAQPVITFEAEAVTGKSRSRSIIGDEIRLAKPSTVRFFINAEGAPSDATISLISNGQVMRQLTSTLSGRPQTVAIECQGDSYFRLEVRDKTGTMLALTNPIYVKVGAHR
jgi:hypothetical protein